MSGISKYKVGDEFPNGKRLIELIGSHPKFRTNLWMWECIKCGTVGGPSLTNSITRPREPRCCMDMSKEKGPRWNGYMEISGTYLGSSRKGAVRRGLEFSVSPEYLWEVWEKQNGKCRYSGRKLAHGVDASIDRIDSSKGYVTGNIQWVHKDINKIKSDFQESEFLSICKDVADFSAGRL